ELRRYRRDLLEVGPDGGDPGHYPRRLRRVAWTVLGPFGPVCEEAEPRLDVSRLDGGLERREVERRLRPGCERLDLAGDCGGVEPRLLAGDQSVAQVEHVQYPEAD